MKRIKKRAIEALFLACVILLFQIDPAQARAKDPFENMKEDVFNEYDYIVSVRKMSREDAENAGISVEELELIYSDYAEKEFLRRGLLSDKELKERYHYSTEQIEQLRAYRGTPLQDSPEMRALSASMSSSLHLFGGTGTIAILTYGWQWSTMPIIRLTDYVAMVWAGTYIGGTNNMTLHSSSYTRVFYYYTDTVYFPVDYSVTSGSALPTVGATSNFPISTGYGDAYRGYMYVKTTLVNMSGPQLMAISAHAEYAHYTISINPGVSFPGGMSISFSGINKIYGVQGDTFYIPDPE